MQIKRVEKKFIINHQERVLLEKRLKDIIPMDKHCVGNESYEIRSLYFDTITDRCCVEKEDGLLVHEKIRIRTYNNSDKVIKLECKHKVGETQVKKSLLITKEILQRILKKDYSCLLEIDNPMGIFFYKKLSKGMFPKSVVQYKRMCYCLDINNIRITIDSDIRSTESCLDLFREPLQATPLLSGNIMVLEVKYSRFLLDYVKHALKGINQTPSSYSKYFEGRRFQRSIIG